MRFKAAPLNFADQMDVNAISSQFTFPLKPLTVSGLFLFLFLFVSFFLTFLITGILKSTCYIDVRWFPFDVQKCDLKFGSWTHNGWLLDLQMLEADISNYISNGEWDLVGELEECSGI